MASNSELNTAVHGGVIQEGSEHCTSQMNKKTLARAGQICEARVASNKFPSNLSQLNDRFINYNVLETRWCLTNNQKNSFVS